MANRLPDAGSECGHENLGRGLDRLRQQHYRARPRSENVVGSGLIVRLDQPERRDDAMGGCGADAVQQLQETEPRDHVTRVVGEAKRRKHVLDMRRLDETQPPVLDVRNASRPELELEERRMVRGTDEHRLLMHRDAGFAMGEDTVAHGVGLRVLVGTAHELRVGTRSGSGGPEDRGETGGGIGSHRIGDVEDSLA